MKHQNWIDATCGSDSVRRIAIESGLPQRTLANQVEKDAISAENVIKIAIAYDAHPVRALVDTGYLDEKYARSIDPATAVKEVSEEVLANEVLERMHRGLQTDALTTPVDELATRREAGVEKQFKGVRTGVASRGRGVMGMRRTARRVSRRWVTAGTTMGLSPNGPEGL